MAVGEALWLGGVSQKLSLGLSRSAKGQTPELQCPQLNPPLFQGNVLRNSNTPSGHTLSAFEQGLSKPDGPGF